MDNKRNKVSLEFDVSDLPMLAEAIGIARNTAMMCSNPGAQKRLEQLRKMVDAMIPPAARVFDAFVWSEICLAIADGSEWALDVQRPSWSPNWEKAGYITVKVGDKIWKSEDTKHVRGDEAYESVEALLRELEPLRPAFSGPKM